MSTETGPDATTPDATTPDATTPDATEGLPPGSPGADAPPEVVPSPPVRPPRRRSFGGSSSALRFADPLGPRGRARVAVATVVTVIVLGALAVVALRRLGERGQLDAKMWKPLVSAEGVRFFLGGLLVTLQAAIVSMALALAAGLVLALARLGRNRPVRWLAVTWIEFFQGIPLILLILFCYFGLPQLGLDLGRYWFLVLALVLYNSAVISHIVRAGILSLDRGQTEAALAVGLTDGQTMRLVVLPQALRRMVPALVTQLVVMVKDTSLGVAIGLEELLRRAQIAGEAERDPLQAYVVATVLYLVVNLTLSAIGRRLEQRQRRVAHVAAEGDITVRGVEDLSV